MKKFTILFILLMGTFIYVAAQRQTTLEIYTDDSPMIKLTNGQDIDVTVVNPLKPTKLDLNVKNPSGSSVDVYLYKRMGTLVTGASNDFCWGPKCYFPEDTLSQAYQIPANTLAIGQFQARYYANNKVGDSRITYLLSIGTNYSDYFRINVNFKNSPQGIENPSLTGPLFTVSPNPAADVVKFHLDGSTLPAGKMVISNQCGSMMKEILLCERQRDYALNVSDLPNGIYFCSLRVSGHAQETHRVIIIH